MAVDTARGGGTASAPPGGTARPSGAAGGAPPPAGHGGCACTDCPHGVREGRRRAEAGGLAAVYEGTIPTPEDVAGRLVALTRTLRGAADEGDEAPRPGHEVTRPYAGFLRQVAAALDAYGRT
ncbi:hypothetical protein ACLIYP_26635, partial [Streptomyces nanhaiensis]